MFALLQIIIHLVQTYVKLNLLQKAQTYDVLKAIGKVNQKSSYQVW